MELAPVCGGLRGELGVVGDRAHRRATVALAAGRCSCQWNDALHRIIGGTDESSDDPTFHCSDAAWRRFNETAPRRHAVDWKLEVAVIPVSDVDRAREFYEKQLGFNVDVDNRMGETFRNVQTTPAGSGCSVTFGTGLTPGLQLCVGDIAAAHAELAGRGVESARSSTSTRTAGRTVRVDPGTRSSSSRIPMATTGPSRRSPGSEPAALPAGRWLPEASPRSQDLARSIGRGRLRSGPRADRPGCSPSGASRRASTA